MAERMAYDALLVGIGPAPAASAVSLAKSGARVALVAGVARPRSIEADCGLVSPAVLEEAFGPADGPPLGPEVRWIRRIREHGRAAPVVDDAEPIERRRAYRRLLLEEWMLRQARSAGVVVLDGFVEGMVLPGEGGALRLMSEDGGQHVDAQVIALCEGADPRIAMRAGLRPDVPPEEQIHFARTLLASVSGEDSGTACVAGEWRTSWGMPVHVAVVPQASGAAVSVAARIENVMRGNRATMDALEEALAAPELRVFVPRGPRVASGVELVILRPNARDLRLASDNLVVGVDASGAIDPRAPARADIALRAGMLLATHLAGRLAGDEAEPWAAVVRRFLGEVGAGPAGYHDSRTSGFIEDVGRDRRLPEPLSRLGRGMLGRLRARLAP